MIGVTSRGVAASFADNLGFAIPVYYVKQFINHREAFAFDKANPNSGYRYLDPPRRQNAASPEGLKDRPRCDRLENGILVVSDGCIVEGRLVGLHRRRQRLGVSGEVTDSGTFTGGQIDQFPPVSQGGA